MVSVDCHSGRSWLYAMTWTRPMSSGRIDARATVPGSVVYLIDGSGPWGRAPQQRSGERLEGGMLRQKLNQVTVCVFIVAAMVLATDASAEAKKAFELNDGSSVIGEVIDELATGYLVRTDDGQTVRVLYDDVKAVYVLGGESAAALSPGDEATSSHDGSGARRPITHLGGIMYSVGDETHDVVHVKTLLGAEPSLLARFERGEREAKASFALLIPGTLVSTAACLVAAAGAFEPAIPLVSAGVGMIIFAAIMNGSGRNKMKTSLRMYNATVWHSSEGTGARLAFEF